MTKDVFVFKVRQRKAGYLFGRISRAVHQYITGANPLSWTRKTKRFGSQVLIYLVDVNLLLNLRTSVILLKLRTSYTWELFLENPFYVFRTVEYIPPGQFIELYILTILQQSARSFFFSVYFSGHSTEFCNQWQQDIH